MLWIVGSASRSSARTRSSAGIWGFPSGGLRRVTYLVSSAPGPAEREHIIEELCAQARDDRPAPGPPEREEGMGGFRVRGPSLPTVLPENPTHPDVTFVYDLAPAA